MQVTINDYAWQVEFVSRDNDVRLRGCDGVTIYNDFLILIRDDLNEIMTKECLIHEITHAVLGTQGRYSQKTFKVEELCEFMGFNAEKILKIAEAVLSGGH